MPNSTRLTSTLPSFSSTKARDLEDSPVGNHVFVRIQDRPDAPPVAPIRVALVSHIRQSIGLDAV